MRGRSLLLALLSAFALGGVTLFVVPGTAHAQTASPGPSVSSVPINALPTAEPAVAEGGYERVMTQDAEFLYVLEGRKLYKIEKGTLQTLAKGSLP